ncbi:MAG TPA: cytochrome c3 family protein [Nitrospirota bacterium]|nr:cytochrome c3 family protein [Nitrospirota bacterium]
MKYAIALVPIIAAIIVPVMIVIGLEGEPHTFKDCTSCHVSQDPKKGSIDAREMKEGVTQLCIKCHKTIFSEGYMHPVDVRPQNVMIPSDMPLSPSGELTCTTCHDVHSAYERVYGSKTHFLRRGEVGKRFCDICHVNSSTITHGHSSSLGEAHFRSQYISSGGFNDLDPMSKNCLTCHDGSYASSATIASVIISHNDKNMQSASTHPIGVDYERASIDRGRRTDLIPMAIVDERIMFFNGKVGCGSCHNPYSMNPKQLVMSDRQSALCCSCHKICT